MIIEKEEIKKARKLINVNQSQLAMILNVSTCTIERREREGVEKASSPSCKNLKYFLKVTKYKKFLEKLIKLLNNNSNYFLAQSYLFALGPIITTIGFEIGDKHLLSKVVKRFKKYNRKSNE